MLPIIFGGKLRKMLVDLLKMSKILMDFLRFFEKSVEFFAPNTDWSINKPILAWFRILEKFRLRNWFTVLHSLKHGIAQAF